MAKKRSIIILSIVAGILLLGGGAAAMVAHYLLRPQFHTTQTTYIYVDRDDTVDSLKHKLTATAEGGDLRAFDWLVRYNKFNDTNVRTGRYAINPADDVRRVFNRLKAGLQTPVNVTVPSVRSLDRMAGTVARQLMTDSVEMARLMHSPQFAEQMGFSPENLYALFIPNTYEVYWNVSAEDFMARMKREHDAFWNADRRAKAQAQNLTMEQVCTLASIVDEETNYTPEKPIVAGLYLNRLKKGWPLQADPTVKFALGDPGIRRITLKDLETESPYNTYKNRGLPPGPIRVPTIKAIDAVLNPEKHNYMFMVAKEDFSGSHNFATTLAEHTRNARKYQQALNERKIFR